MKLITKVVDYIWIILIIFILLNSGYYSYYEENIPLGLSLFNTGLVMYIFYKVNKKNGI